MSAVPRQACLRGVQDVLGGSQYGQAEAFLGMLPWETWPAVLLSASDRERETLSSATEVKEQIPEFREKDYM